MAAGDTLMIDWEPPEVEVRRELGTRAGTSPYAAVVYPALPVGMVVNVTCQK